MNPWVMEPPRSQESRVWRWGIGLALVAVLYVAAVIAFIIAY
jgi:predicted tellurium resistance membrane protein TerC